jgi:Protein of unknown function (DUF1573)
MKLVAFFCLWWTVAAGAEPAPKIQFDRAVYDFGSTSLVESVSGTFIFRNAGDAVLRVQEPKPSCGCTVAKLSSDTLKPGEAGELAFTLRFVNADGIIEKDIAVPSNDPQNPSLKLTIRVKVLPTVAVSPQLLFVGDVSLGQAGNASVVVKRLDGKKLAITRAEGTKDFVILKVEPIEDSEGQAERLIATTIRPDGSPRRFTDLIRVYTADMPTPIVLIPVVGRFLSAIMVEPEAFRWTITDPEHWPGPDPERSVTRHVVVYPSDENRQLEIRNVASSLKELQVDLSPTEAGGGYQITATLPLAPAEPEQGDITFETNLPELPKASVPVTIELAKPE